MPLLSRVSLCAVLLLVSATPRPLSAQHRKALPKKAAPAAKKPADTAPAAAANLSPVGHWMQKANPNTDLQLWWDFHADGTLTVTAGATVRTVWHLEGAVLTVGAAGPKQAPGVFDIKFADGKLFSTPRTPNPPTLEYTRLGMQRYDSAPLVGKWQITGAPHAIDPHEEEVRNRMVRAITAYNPDGSYEVRAPIDATSGTWDDTRHTYTLKGYPEMSYERAGTTLTLASPVGPKGKHTYVPDAFY